jgi:hypothetical protein
MELSPLSGVLEDHGVALYLEVLAPERGNSIGLALFGVAFIADPEVGRVHQARHAG